MLAGGLASRMGGRDKGLQPFRGRVLIEWVLERLAPQVGELIISANRNLADYERLGFRVVSDDSPAGRGPLAGMLAGMRAARHAWLLTVPCDAPYLPHDLALRLGNALDERGGPCAVAHVVGRMEPVFSLSSTALAAQLESFLASGGRAVQAWQRSIGAIEVAFDQAAASFAPLNTPEALHTAQDEDA